MHAAPDSLIKRRKPLFALLMSLILPGLGQLYNGEINKAIWLMLLFVALTVPAVGVVALYLPQAWLIHTLLAGFGLVVLMWLYGMIDAFRSARRKPNYLPQSWQGSGVYVLVFLLCTAALFPVLIGVVRQYQVESFRVPSGSMEPTVMTGDMFFADKRYNCPGCKAAVKRGDIAIFVYPNDRTMYFIKRIIGIPGDHVQVKGRTVFINGKPLTAQETPLAKGGTQVTETDGTTSWQVVWSSDGKNLPQTDVTVPAGSVFAMGDNRSASHDSRFFGFIPLQDVVGKARQVWLSLDTKAQHVRWERSGQVLK